MSEIAKQLELLKSQIVSVVRGYVERSMTEMKAAIAALDDRIAGIPAGAKGADGTSVTIDDVRPFVTEFMESAVKNLPAPERGPAGQDGKDADPVAMRDAVNECVNKAVAALPPARDGKDCDMAAVQLLVDAAVKSAVAGIPKAVDGEDGRDGRDAIELQIEPEIASTKRYPRGAWARHAGGLVRAVCDTRPLEDVDLERAGWEVVIDGLKAIQIEQSGDRVFRVVAERTSGEKSALECAMPVLLDRGRYSDEKSYEVGDVVDWSGSMWIAQEPSKGIEPRPDAAAWRLSVRRGRDGKDAVVRTIEPQRVKV